jgi:hypothetical protein
VALTDFLQTAVWAAAGFEDTLSRWNLKLELGYGNETAVQPGAQRMKKAIALALIGLAIGTWGVGARAVTT